MCTKARLLLTAFFATLICHAQSDGSEEFQVTNDPLPDTFQLKQSYPDRSEVVECRPIRLRIERNSRRYRTELVTNDHPSIHFAHADSRVMSNRLFRRLNQLAGLFHEEHGAWITVLKAWTEYGDGEVDDPTSLHFEGRTVRVVVALNLFSALLRLAVQVGFDWVYFADPTYVRMSVVPDLCDISLDLVFLLDQSGSVGPENHSTAISFLQDVVSFFTVASNRTQISLVTYSTGAAIQFDLNDYPSQELVISALGQIQYTGGWTATALALTLGRWVLDPGRNYGARPFSEGIPKVAVLITDGKSNLYSITNQANNLRNFGVQVYTVGIGSINLPELMFIASDPDSEHVFLLDSFNDAENFVDLLSFSTCDAPAIVEPGDNTTSEIEEEEFRFFQSQCAAFSQTVMIEQIDLVGRCSLYASSTVQNPGPLDPLSTVVRNETRHSSSRYVHLTLPYVLLNRFVYMSVLGKNPVNTFSIVIWDSIFEQDDYTVQVLEGITTAQEIINLSEEIVMTDATFEFSIVEGNEDGLFELAPDTGILTLTQPVAANDFFELKIVAQNTEHDCHKARVIVRVEVIANNVEFPELQPVSVPETAGINDLVTMVTVTGAFDTVTYSIVSGNTGGVFQINPQSGEIRVAASLDFETQSQYNLTIEGRSSLTTASDTAVQVINVVDVNEQPMFVTSCALSNSCNFPVAENEPAGTVVGTVVAMDPDSSTLPNGMLTYTLQPNTFPFQVSGSGVITTTQPLSHEDMVTYSLTLVVQDGGTPSLSTETTIVVQVIVEDENTPPVFPNTCEVDVFENIDVGDAVLQCIAVDTDEQGNTNTNLDYQIIAGNIGNTFEFNPSFGPGVIVTAAPLDREERDRYVLTITATDAGGLSGTTDVTINIFDRNDNAPECMAPTNPVVITDVQLQSRSNDVTTIVAMDDDIEENAVAVFSIESSEPNDLLTSTVVTIRVTDSLDGTLTSTCSLTIQFEDTCAIQQYDIDPSTGVLTSQLLCRVSVEPSPLEAIEGSNKRLFCPIVRNVPVSYRWLHNDTGGSTIDLPDSEDAGALLLTFIRFEDSGDYVCRAENSIGSLESEPSVLSVLVPPAITTPPEDLTVQVGEMAELTCAASGIPEPEISWFRTIGGTQVIVTSNGRVLVSGGFLRIAAVEAGDQGEYTCSASNSVGTATESAMLQVFSLQQVVVAAVDEYSMPSVDESCHEFNSSDFNAVMTSITDHTTIATTQKGDDLCPPSPCNPNPCHNGGNCQNDTTALHGYVCHCAARFTGDNCAEMIDPCTETTCENGGVCASTSTGHFICTCSNGFHGDHCQYTDVCSTSPCPAGETCVETVVNTAGFVCQVVSADSAVMVEPADTEAAVLEDQVNGYMEMTADSPNNRKKRATNNDATENSFVTVCEARFIPFPPSSNTLLLVWACPVGVEEPDNKDEELICQLLIQQRMVKSCSSPSGGMLKLPPPTILPPTSINISFILVDPDSLRPLSASEVLDILQRSGALEKLQNTSYRASSFSPAVAPTTRTSSDNSGEVVGAVVGVVLACALIASLVVTALCFAQHKRRAKENVVLSEAGSIRISHSQNGNGMAGSSLIVHNPHSSMETHPNSSKSKEQVFTFQPPTPLSDSLLHGRKPIFDDPIYEAGLPTPVQYHPPETQRPRKTSTLERGVQLFRERVSSLKRSDSASAECLLSDVEDSGDYQKVSKEGHLPPPDRPPPPLPPRPLRHKNRSKLEGGEAIYGNTQHQKVGALGNAGQRWESYWQTRTLFRTDEPDSDSAMK